MSQCWRRISLKSDVVCQSYDNLYRGTVFSWTQCRSTCYYSVLLRFFYVFYVFFKIQKRDFLRFFALLHTFSRTMLSAMRATHACIATSPSSEHASSLPPPVVIPACRQSTLLTLSFCRRNLHVDIVCNSEYHTTCTGTSDN